MVQMSGKLKRWGNSFGVLIPRDVVEEANLKEDQEVDLIILPRDNTVRDLFGLLKGKSKVSAQKMKDQMRKELYDDP